MSIHIFQIDRQIAGIGMGLGFGISNDDFETNRA